VAKYCPNWSVTASDSTWLKVVSINVKKPTISHFEAFGIFLLATTEDEDGEFIAITMANLALQEWCAHEFNKCYGH